MQRSSRSRPPRSRATLRPRDSQGPPIRYSLRERGGRIQKQVTRSRISNRTSTARRDADLNYEARDIEPTPAFLGATARAGELTRQGSIHACSEASLQFVGLSSLETDEDTDIIALNLMDYFLFSPENWLPELSYCKLHAACFLFASRITGKWNSINGIAYRLSPDSPFVQLVGSPLAGDEESAAAIQYTISVSEADVEDGYALLYERQEMFSHLLGQYRNELDKLPIPHLNEMDDAAIEKEGSENWDIFDVEE